MASPANPLVGPVPSVKNKGSFWKDLKDVRTVGGWVGTALTVISVLSLGLPGMVKFLTDKLSETIEFWKSILVTAPLTAAIAVIGVCLLRKWLRDWRWLLLFSVGTVAAASWLASCFDNPGRLTCTPFRGRKSGYRRCQDMVLLGRPAVACNLLARPRDADDDLEAVQGCGPAAPS
jgi:hypothetical protein